MSGLFKKCQCLGTDDFRTPNKAVASNNTFNLKTETNFLSDSEEVSGIDTATTTNRIPTGSYSNQKDKNIKVLELQHQGLEDLPSYYLNHDKTVRELHLELNNLASIPKLITFFTGLKYLNVSENEIETISAEIGELNRLKELDANKNNIHEIDESIVKCQNLRILNFGVNPLKQMPPCLTQLTNLSELYFNETQLDELPESIGNLVNLKILELRENNLSILPKSLCLMSKLERLDIGNNDFTDLPDVIGTLFSLKELWCDMNELTIVPSFIGCLKSLDCLDVSKNKINYVSSDISGCSLLTDLHLSFNHLKELPDTIGCLTRLSTVKIDSNQLIKLPQQLFERIRADEKIIKTFDGDQSNCGDETYTKKPSGESWKELILTNNCLSYIPVWIGNLINLQTLYLDDNLLEELPSDIGNCRDLAILSARNNRLREVPEEISKLSNLKVLNLCDNKLRSLPASLLKLSQLTALWLEKNQSNPLVPMQVETDLITKKQILTCVLLPQLESDENVSLGSINSTSNKLKDTMMTRCKQKSENCAEVTFQERGNQLAKYFSPSALTSHHKRGGGAASNGPCGKFVVNNSQGISSGYGSKFNGASKFSNFSSIQQSSSNSTKLKSILTFQEKYDRDIKNIASLSISTKDDTVKNNKTSKNSSSSTKQTPSHGDMFTISSSSASLLPKNNRLQYNKPRSQPYLNDIITATTANSSPDDNLRILNGKLKDKSKGKCAITRVIHHQTSKNEAQSSSTTLPEDTILVPTKSEELPVRQVFKSSGTFSTSLNNTNRQVISRLPLSSSSINAPFTIQPICNDAVTVSGGIVTSTIATTMGGGTNLSNSSGYSSDGELARLASCVAAVNFQNNYNHPVLYREPEEGDNTLLASDSSSPPPFPRHDIVMDTNPSKYKIATNNSCNLTAHGKYDIFNNSNNKNVQFLSPQLRSSVTINEFSRYREVPVPPIHFHKNKLNFSKKEMASTRLRDDKSFIIQKFLGSSSDDLEEAHAQSSKITSKNYCQHHFPVIRGEGHKNSAMNVHYDSASTLIDTTGAMKSQSSRVNPHQCRCCHHCYQNHNIPMFRANALNQTNNIIQRGYNSDSEQRNKLNNIPAGGEQCNSVFSVKAIVPQTESLSIAADDHRHKINDCRQSFQQRLKYHSLQCSTTNQNAFIYEVHDKNSGNPKRVVDILGKMATNGSELATRSETDLIMTHKLSMLDDTIRDDNYNNKPVYDSSTKLISNGKKGHHDKLFDKRWENMREPKKNYHHHKQHQENNNIVPYKTLMNNTNVNLNFPVTTTDSEIQRLSTTNGPTKTVITTLLTTADEDDFNKKKIGGKLEKRNFLKDKFWTKSSKNCKGDQEDSNKDAHTTTLRDEDDLSMDDDSIKNTRKFDVLSLTMVKKRGELGFSVIGGKVDATAFAEETLNVGTISNPQCKMCRAEGEKSQREVSYPRTLQPQPSTTEVKICRDEISNGSVQDSSVENDRRQEKVKEQIVEYFKSVGADGHKEVVENYDYYSGHHLSRDDDVVTKIYVNKILREGPADGILRKMDEIVSVNGESFIGMSHEEAVSVLKCTKSIVKIVVKRMRKRPRRFSEE